MWKKVKEGVTTKDGRIFYEVLLVRAIIKHWTKAIQNAIERQEFSVDLEGAGTVDCLAEVAEQIKRERSILFKDNNTGDKLITLTANQSIIGTSLRNMAHLMLTRHEQDSLDVGVSCLLPGCLSPYKPIHIAIAGGGLTGLTFAMLLVQETLTSADAARRRPLRISIYDGRWMREGHKVRWRHEHDEKSNNRRRQVITLQDAVVDLLDDGIDSGTGMDWAGIVWPVDAITGQDSSERVYVDSRQALIADVEDRLLAKIDESPLYKSMINLHPYKLDEKEFPRIRESCNLLVGADSAGPNAFTVNQVEDQEDAPERSEEEPGSTAPEDRWFTDQVVARRDADHALGIEIHAKSSRTKAEIVYLTLCQTIFLLNSTSAGKGFLNIRLSQTYYDALKLLTDQRSQTLEDLSGSEEPTIIVIAELIRAGLRYYGLSEDAVSGSHIRIFALPLRSVVDPVYMCKRTPRTPRGEDDFPVVVVGDAAVQHNFWPGRGANSGLMMAWVLAGSISRSFGDPRFTKLDASHFTSYSAFVTKVRSREQRGRGDFIQQINTGPLFTQALNPSSRYRVGSILRSLSARCRGIRTGLQAREEFRELHPLEVSDLQIFHAMLDLVDTTSVHSGAICDLLDRSQAWPTGQMNRAPELLPRDDLPAPFSPGTYVYVRNQIPAARDQIMEETFQGQQLSQLFPVFETSNVTKPQQIASIITEQLSAGHLTNFQRLLTLSWD